MKLDFFKGSRRARLLETVTVCGMVIKKGFVFNGANIPIWAVIFIWLTRWHPKVRDAACGHDWWWQQGDLSGCLEHARKCYHKGNEMLRKQMRKDNANRYQVFVAYHAVRFSGWVRWHKKRRKAKAMKRAAA